MKILHDDYSEDDKLGHDLVRDATVTLICSVERKAKSSFTIGIYGEWGSGKTSMLRQIRSSLKSEQDIITLWFNPWRYSEGEDIVPALFEHLSNELEEKTEILSTNKSNGKEPKKLTEFVEKFKKVTVALVSGVNAKISIPGMASLSYDGKQFANMLETDQANNKKIYYGIADYLEESVANMDYRIVVFIDDMDRCSPKRSIELLEALKVLLDLPGFVFVIGVDFELIEQAVRNKFSAAGRNDFEGNYLDKIIQFPIHIPSPNKEKIKTQFISGFLESLGNNRDLYSDIIINVIGLNPRSIKRFMNVVEFTLELSKRRATGTQTPQLELIRVSSESQQTL